MKRFSLLLVVAIGSVDSQTASAGLLNFTIDPEESYIATNVTYHFDGVDYPASEQVPGSSSFVAEGSFEIDLSDGLDVGPNGNVTFPQAYLLLPSSSGPTAGNAGWQVDYVGQTYYLAARNLNAQLRSPSPVPFISTPTGHSFDLHAELFFDTGSLQATLPGAGFIISDSLIGLIAPMITTATIDTTNPLQSVIRWEFAYKSEGTYFTLETAGQFVAKTAVVPEARSLLLMAAGITLPLSIGYRQGRSRGQWLKQSSA